MSHDLISAATFVRAGVANYADSDLVIQEAVAAVARSAHYTEKGLKSLLLEDTRENLALHSEALNDGDWTKTRVTIGTDALISPDDAVTADSIIEDSSASATHFVEQNATITAAAFITYSHHVKIGTRTFVKLICEDGGAANGFEAWFNLTTGAVGTSGVVGAGTTFTAARMTLSGNGYYRCEIVGKLAAGITSCDFRIHLADADNSDSYNGDGASLVYAFGGQLEDQAEFASSYIKTVAAAVTRVVDKISWPMTLTPQAMTIYVRFVERGTAKLAAGTKILQIGKSDDTDPMITIEAAGSSLYRASHDNNVASPVTASGTITAVSFDDLIELRLVLFSDGAIQLHQSKNGAAEVSTAKTAAHTLAAAWSAVILWLNSVGTTGTGFCAFNSVKVARGVQTLAFMRSYDG